MWDTKNNDEILNKKKTQLLIYTIHAQITTHYAK